MLLIVGQDVADAKGGLIVRDIQSEHAGAGDASWPERATWWPCTYWPEVQQLVAFDAERIRLGLPPMTSTTFH